MVELRRVMVKAKVKTVTINTSHNRCVEEKKEEKEEETAPLCLWIDGWRSITFVLVLLFIFGEWREREGNCFCYFAWE